MSDQQIVAHPPRVSDLVPLPIVLQQHHQQYFVLAVWHSHSVAVDAAAVVSAVVGIAEATVEADLVVAAIDSSEVAVEAGLLVAAVLGSETVVDAAVVEAVALEIVVDSDVAVEAVVFEFDVVDLHALSVMLVFGAGASDGTGLVVVVPAAAAAAGGGASTKLATVV